MPAGADEVVIVLRADAEGAVADLQAFKDALQAIGEGDSLAGLADQFSELTGKISETLSELTDRMASFREILSEGNANPFARIEEGAQQATEAVTSGAEKQVEASDQATAASEKQAEALAKTGEAAAESGEQIAATAENYLRVESQLEVAQQRLLDLQTKLADARQRAGMDEETAQYQSLTGVMETLGVQTEKAAADVTLLEEKLRQINLSPIQQDRYDALQAKQQEMIDQSARAGEEQARITAEANAQLQQQAEEQSATAKQAIDLDNQRIASQQRLADAMAKLVDLQRQAAGQEGGPSSGQAAQIDALSSATERYAAQLAVLQDRLANLNLGTEEAAKLDSLRAAQQAIVDQARTVAESSGQQAQSFDLLGRAAGAAGEAVARAGELIGSAVTAGVDAAEGALSRLTTALRDVAGVAGLGALGALGGAVGQAANLQYGLSKTEGLALDTTNMAQANAQTEQLKNTLLSLGTQVPVPLNQLNDALYRLISAGIQTGDAENVLATASKAATAGHSDLTPVVVALTSALNAYHVNLKDSNTTQAAAAQYMDVLTKGVQEGNVEFQSFASSLGRVMPLAAALNVSFPEVVANLSTLTRTGSSASEAVTQLSAVFNELLTQPPKGEAALEGLGLSYTKLLDTLRNQGLVATFQELDNAMKAQNLSGTQYDETLHQIFPNIRAIRDELSAWSSQSGTYKAILTSLSDSTGIVNRAFEVTQQTLHGAIGQIRNDFSVLLAEVGGAALAPLAAAAEKVGEVFTRITQAFRDHPDWASMAGELTSLAAAFGIAAGGAAVLSNALLFMGSNLGPLFIGLGSMGGLIDAVLPPVASLAAAIIGLKVAWDTNFLGMRTTLENLGIGPVLQQAETLLRSLGTAADEALHGKFQQALTDAGTALRTFLSQLGGQGDTQFLSNLLAAFGQLGQRILSALSGVSEGLGHLVGEWTTTIVEGLGQIGTKIAAAILPTLVPAATEIATQFLFGLSTGLLDGLDRIVTDFTGQFTHGLGQGITEGVASLVTVLGGAIAALGAPILGITTVLAGLTTILLTSSGNAKALATGLEIAAGAVVGLMVAQQLTPVIAALGAAIDTLYIQLALGNGLFAGLETAFMGLLNPITLIGAGFGALVIGLMKANDAWGIFDSEVQVHARSIDAQFKQIDSDAKNLHWAPSEAEAAKLSLVADDLDRIQQKYQDIEAAQKAAATGGGVDPAQTILQSPQALHESMQEMEADITKLQQEGITAGHIWSQIGESATPQIQQAIKTVTEMSQAELEVAADADRASAALSKIGDTQSTLDGVVTRLKDMHASASDVQATLSQFTGSMLAPLDGAMQKLAQDQQEAANGSKVMRTTVEQEFQGMVSTISRVAASLKNAGLNEDQIRAMLIKPFQDAGPQVEAEANRVISDALNKAFGAEHAVPLKLDIQSEQTQQNLQGINKVIQDIQSQADAAKQKLLDLLNGPAGSNSETAKQLNAVNLELDKRQFSQDQATKAELSSVPPTQASTDALKQKQQVLGSLTSDQSKYSADINQFLLNEAAAGKTVQQMNQDARDQGIAWQTVGVPLDQVNQRYGEYLPKAQQVKAVTTDQGAALATLTAASMTAESAQNAFNEVQDQYGGKLNGSADATRAFLATLLSEGTITQETANKVMGLYDSHGQLIGSTRTLADGTVLLSDAEGQIPGKFQPGSEAATAQADAFRNAGTATTGMGTAMSGLAGPAGAAASSIDGTASAAQRMGGPVDEAGRSVATAGTNAQTGALAWESARGTIQSASSGIADDARSAIGDLLNMSEQMGGQVATNAQTAGQSVKTALDTTSSDVQGGIEKLSTTVQTGALQAGQQLPQSLAQGIDGATPQATQAVLTTGIATSNALFQVQTVLMQSAQQAGQQTVTSLAQAIVSSAAVAVGAVQAMGAAVSATIASVGQQLYQTASAAGILAGEGLAAGINAGIPAAQAAASNLAAIATQALQAKLQIQSPSRVWMGLGQLAGEGAAAGIDASTPTIVAATNRQWEQVTQTVAAGSQRATKAATSGSSSGSSSQNPEVQIADTMSKIASAFESGLKALSDLENVSLPANLGDLIQTGLSGLSQIWSGFTSAFGGLDPNFSDKISKAADAVQKSVSAVGQMATVLKDLAPFASGDAVMPSSDLIEGTVAWLQQIYAELQPFLAGQDPVQADAIAKVADDTGKVMASLKSVADLMKAVQSFQPVDGGQIDAFLAGVVDLLSRLSEHTSELTALRGSLAGISSLDTSLKTALGDLTQAATLLKDLGSFRPVDSSQIDAFLDQYVLLLQKLGQKADEVAAAAPQMQEMARGMAQLKTVLETATAGATFLKDLGSYRPADFDQVQQFLSDFVVLIGDLVPYTDDFTAAESQITQIGNAMSGLKNVLETLKSGADSMKAISGYQGMDPAQVQRFLGDFVTFIGLLDSTLTQITTQTQNDLVLADTWQKALKDLFDSFKAGAETLKVLDGYRPVSPETVQKAVSDIVAAAQVFLTALTQAGGINQQALSATALWNSDLKNLLDVFKAGAETLKSLESYLQVDPARIQAAAAQTVNAAVALAQSLGGIDDLQKRSVEDAQAWATDTKTLLDVIKVGLDDLKTLGTESLPDEAQIQTAAQRIVSATTTFAAALARASQESRQQIDDAAGISAHLQAVLTTLKDGVDALKALSGTDFRFDRPIDEFVTVFTQAITRFSQALLAPEIANLPDAASQIASKLTSVVTLLKDSVDGLSKLGGLVLPSDNQVAQLARGISVFVHELAQQFADMDQQTAGDIGSIGTSIQHVFEGLKAALDAVSAYADLALGGKDGKSAEINVLGALDHLRDLPREIAYVLKDFALAMSDGDVQAAAAEAESAAKQIQPVFTTLKDALDTVKSYEDILTGGSSGSSGSSAAKPVTLSADQNGIAAMIGSKAQINAFVGGAGSLADQQAAGTSAIQSYTAGLQTAQNSGSSGSSGGGRAGIDPVAGLSQLKDFAQKMAAMLQDLAGIWKGVSPDDVSAAQTFMTTVQGVMTALEQAANAVANWKGGTSAGGLSQIQQFSQQFAHFVLGMPKLAIDSIGDTTKTLFSKGADLITGLIAGMQSEKTDFADTVKSFSTLASDSFGQGGSAGQQGPDQQQQGGQSKQTMFQPVIDALQKLSDRIDSDLQTQITGAQGLDRDLKAGLSTVAQQTTLEDFWHHAATEQTQKDLVRLMQQILASLGAQSGGGAPHLASGGYTAGGGAAADGGMLAVLHPNELVLPLSDPARTQSLLGRYLGSGLPRFEDGGLSDASSSGTNNASLGWLGGATVNDAYGGTEEVPIGQGFPVLSQVLGAAHALWDGQSDPFPPGGLVDPLVFQKIALSIDHGVRRFSDADFRTLDRYDWAIAMRNGKDPADLLSARAQYSLLQAAVRYHGGIGQLSAADAAALGIGSGSGSGTIADGIGNLGQGVFDTQDAMIQRLIDAAAGTQFGGTSGGSYNDVIQNALGSQGLPGSITPTGSSSGTPSTITINVGVTSGILSPSMAQSTAAALAPALRDELFKVFPQATGY